MRPDPFLAASWLAESATVVQFYANAAALAAGLPVDPLGAGLNFLAAWWSFPPRAAAHAALVLTRW